MPNQHTSDSRHRVYKWLKRRPKGRTTAEIAEALGMTVPAVYGVLHRGEDWPPSFGRMLFATGQWYEPRFCEVNRRKSWCWRVIG